MIDVVDALVALVKPLDGGLTYDDTLAAPFEWQPDTVYAWAETVIHRPAGTGEVREEFEVMLVRTVPNEGEEAQLRRSRAVSVALAKWRSDVLDLIREYANVPPWSGGNIVGRSDEDFLRQLEIRGVGVMVGGYRFLDRPNS